MSKHLRACIVATAVLAGGLLLLPSSFALAGSEAPVNDNFLPATNLNAPYTPLNSTATLEQDTDTVGATLQSNILSPCGSTACLSGPPEMSTCDGVSYGKTVWYDFYPDHNGQVEIRTGGIPNVIVLYRYNPFTLVPTLIQCEPGSVYASNELFAYVQAGVDYTYQIGGRDGAGGALGMRFNYAYQSDLTVTPFLTAPIFSEVTGNPQATRLVGLKLVGLARGEQVSVECQACGGATFGDQVTSGNANQLRSDEPIASGPRTRLIVGASSPAQIGRFRIYAVNPATFRLSLLSGGCLAPGTASVSATPNAFPCPVPRLVNPIGAEYVFWEGAHDVLWEKWYSGAKWNGPVPVPAGQLGSAPAVAAQADGEQDVFWKGTNGNLFETSYTGQWNQPVGRGGGVLGSAPTVGVDSAGDEYVFWKGTDNRLWERSYSAGSWSQPVALGAAGKLGSGPAVAVHSDGEQDVFWKGMDGHLWETWFTGTWNQPINLGGQLGSAPCVAIDGAGDEYVFWRGADHGLWEKAYVDGGWGRATPIRAGVLGSAPTVAVHANGEQDVFWKGTNGDLWETWYTNRWHRPIDLRGRLGSGPSAGVDAAGKQGTAPNG